MADAGGKRVLWWVQLLKATLLTVAGRFSTVGMGVTTARILVRELSAIEHAAAALKAKAAVLVAESGSWKADGDRSPAHQLARETGTSPGEARQTIDTGRRMQEQPGVDQASSSGALSPAQAAVIARAVEADGGAERRLVELAGRASLGELRTECARVIAAADADAEARRQRVHAARFASRRDLPDGSAQLLYRATPDEVGEVWRVLSGYAKEAFDHARLEGRREGQGAYCADGLLAMARAAAAAGAAGAGADVVAEDGTADAPSAAGEAEGEPQADEPTERSGSGPPTEGSRPAGPTGRARPPGRGRVRRPVAEKVIVRVDHAALLRGYVEGGEVCEIEGVGPVPISVVEDILARGDPFLAAVVTEGDDVRSVVHLGRRPTAKMITALEWLGVVCARLGCGETERLQRDHREDWADTRVTRLAALEWMCTHDHNLKTRDGWALVPGVGVREMVPPDDPRHPANVDQRRARHGGAPSGPRGER